MKNTIYILALLISISSCRSIDKMIESGNYDQALRYGVDKLRGKQNKKTKYVKGLEKAYAKLNKTDIKEIEKLQYNRSKNSMDRVVDIYQRMEDRQNYIYPLLPLISEDNYEATIDIRNYNKLITDAMNEASETHYQIGVQNLETARVTKDKISARKAYSNFIDASQYIDNYKDTYILKDEALKLGTTNILVESYAAGSNNAFYHTENILNQIPTNNLNNKWTKYHLNENENTKIDYIATIEVSEIIPGKESERYNSFTNTKEVIDGKKPKKTKNGRPLLDTLGNIIYIDKKIIVSANVEELRRSKEASMSGKLIIVDSDTNNFISATPINVTHNFEDYSIIFKGDKRALTSDYINHIKEHCEPFPTDYIMTTNLANEYKEIAEQAIRNIRII